MPRSSLHVPADRATGPRVRARITAALSVLALAGTLLVAAAVPATASAGPRLTWRPPALSSPTTVTVSSTNRTIKLSAGRDYVVKMPKTPLNVKGGLIIAGGRNVVLIGGEIRITNSSTRSNDKRGLYLKNQTGTIHVEGLKITGSTLAEGINLDQRSGGTVQLQNIRVDTVQSRGVHHSDVLQTWGGPATLRVDRLTGYTTYQGFFLDPTKYGSPQPRLFDFRNVNLVGKSGSKYLLWRDGKAWPSKAANVWAKPYTSTSRGQFLRPDTSSGWGAVKVGIPSTGDVVPATRAGVSYVSPGYL